MAEQVSKKEYDRIEAKSVERDYADQRMAEHREDAGMSRDQIEYPGAAIVDRTDYSHMNARVDATLKDPRYKEIGFYGHFLPSHFKKTRIIDTYGR
jgi:hypothetical protein